MDELLDMIIADESPSSVASNIKDMLFVKATERVDSMRAPVSSSMFDSTESEVED
jgi:hypothetical protein